VRFVEFKTFGDMVAGGVFKDIFTSPDKPAPEAPASKPGLPLNKIEVTDVMGSKRPGYIHQGVDLKAATGTPVKATIDGQVTFAGWNDVGGLAVMIDTGKERKDSFHHLSKISVKRGDKVKVGDIVGFSGATGKVSGPHLHWQVNIRGRNVDPLAGQQWTWAQGYGDSSQAGRRKK
jgi:murein DD-endopeptidase MepM/ murein hydrolase activator NlpD